MSSFINIPILCSGEGYNETLAELGIPQEGGVEHRTAFIQRSAIAMVYPTNKGLVNVELLDGLNCTTNVPIKELLKLLDA